MEAQTQTERLKQLIEWLTDKGVVKSRKELADRIGYSNANFSRIFNGNSPVTQKLMDALHKFDQSINTNWLISGEGNMITPNSMDAKNVIINNMQNSMNDALKLMNKGYEMLSSMQFEDKVSQIHAMEVIKKSGEVAEAIATSIGMIGLTVPMKFCNIKQSVIITKDVDGEVTKEVMDQCNSVVELGNIEK